MSVGAGGLGGSLSERHAEDANWSLKPEEETHLSLLRTSLAHKDLSTIILLKSYSKRQPDEMQNYFK